MQTHPINIEFYQVNSYYPCVLIVIFLCSENDEDYSASVNAILHKRLSIRKCKYQKQRRSSSPVSSMVPDDASLLSDRRRSSAFTTSSGE